MRLLIFILIFSWFVSGWPQIWQNPPFPPKIQFAFASATVTAATGGSAISADTNSNNGTGAYTALTNPAIIEGAVGDVGIGTIILNAPTGFGFDTGTNVTLTVTHGTCSGGGNKSVKLGTGAGADTEVVAPGATTITNNVKTASTGAAGCISTLTYTNVRVRPTSAGSTLSTGNITKSASSTSTIVGVTNGSTNFGTLTEVAGAKNKLAVTTQPSSTTIIATDFTTKPVVTLQDQFGNTVTTDSTSTVTEAVVLSTQACGGTAGSGSLTSTPASGSAVSSGIMTYTAMQYSAVESIKICFSSSGVTSILTGAVNVITLPTVTTQAASSVADTTATGNGNITATGGESNDKQGFVYDTSTHSLPGNVAPGSSGYASSAETTGSFGTGAFTKALSSLSTATTYYARAYAHNTAGYSYGGEVNFLTTPAAPTSVAATDGAYTDKVTITWTKSTGATNYHVWRDTTDLGAAGDVATFDDTGAGAPTVTAGTASVTDGSATDKVTLSISGASANNGTTYTYKVVASNAAGNSADSATNTGYRGVGSLTYQWNRSSGDADSGYSTLSGATTAPYDDTTAPAPTITAGTASASDGTSTVHVALSVSGQSANSGAGRYFYATLSATGASSQDTTHDRGYIGVGSLTYQWQRSAADSDASYGDISGATSASYNDTGAPADGSGRYFKVVLNATGATQQISASDRGYRSVGSITTDIVNSSYVSVGSPSMAMGSSTFSLVCQTVTGSFGTASEQIYVNNNNGANNGWTLTVAAQAVTNVWDSTGTDYDFNDPTGSGCTDGGDADSLGGQMTINPSAATLAVGQCGGCSTANISKGSSSAFNQGTTDSITLLTATASSDDVGDWTLRGVSISQKIPAEQPSASDYDINMVLTVTAS